MVAFAFGLIHGFGFASVLRDLGLPQGALLIALVGFNLGVEVGQLAIVSAFLPIAYALRASWVLPAPGLRRGVPSRSRRSRNLARRTGVQHEDHQPLMNCLRNPISSRHRGRR